MLWLLVSISTWIGVHAFGNATCMTSECSTLFLTCVNGGLYQAAQCLEHPSCPKNYDPTKWNLMTPCNCPNGYYGSDCGLVSDATICTNRGNVLDGGMLNSNGLNPADCRLVFDADKTAFFNIFDHRISLTLDSTNGNLNFDMVGRLTDGNVCSEGMHIITCALSSCTTVSDAANYVQVDCLTKNCSSCATCSPLIIAFIDAVAASKQPISWNLPLAPSGSTSFETTITLRTDTAAMVLPVSCYSGACFATNQHKQVIPAVITPPSGLIPMISIVSLVFLSVTVVFILAWRQLRRLQRVSFVGADGTVNEPASVAFQPLSEAGDAGLFWENVSYRARGEARILDSIFGIVAPGTVLAIMGPSGAGKSTLLDILSGSHKSGIVSGRVMMYRPSNVSDKLIRIGYVEQDEVFLPTLTAREAVQFSAFLRLELPDAMIHDRVETILDDLHLSGIADRRISVLSGGERRRLAIALELIMKPAILFLDEPTSGLDAHAATLVVQVLNRLAKTQGCTVLMSIHQPPSDVFPLLDQILLLHQQKVAYLGAPSDAIAFAASIGKSMPALCNPLEHLVTEKVRHSLLSHFGTSDTFKESTKRRRDVAIQSRIQSITAAQYEWSQATTASDTSSFMWLATRSLLHARRDSGLVRMHVWITALVGLLLGMTYRNVDTGIPGSQNRMGVLFFMVLYFSLVSMSSIGSFVSELDLFYRERSRGYYTATDFFLTRLLTDVVPFRILPPLFFGSISYWLIGLQPDLVRFTSFLTVLVLTNVVAMSICFAYSVLFGSVGKANLAAILTFMFSLLFGGLFLNSTTGSTVFSNVRYASFMFYAYASLMSNEFAGLTLEWAAQGLPPVQLTGEQILLNFGMSASYIPWYVVALIGWCAVATSITWILLSCSLRKSR